jgi:hypothetical protein
MADLLSNSTVGGVSISENLHPDMASYIVEQGTSDAWTYIKYSNGFVMCWGTASSYHKSVSGSNGNFTGTLPVSFSSSIVFSSPTIYNTETETSFVSGTVSGNTLTLVVSHYDGSRSKGVHCRILILGYA